MLINKKKKTAKKQQIMIKNYFKSTPSWTIFLQGWQKVKFLYFETFVTIVPYGQDRCVNCHRELAIEYLMNIDGIVLSTRDPEHGLYRSCGEGVSFGCGYQLSIERCTAERQVLLLLIPLLLTRASLLIRINLNIVFNIEANLRMKIF